MMAVVAAGLISSPSAAAERSADASGEAAAGQVDQLIAAGIEARRAREDTRALELFQRAEKLEPDSARVRVHLAATYQALGNWEEADRYLSLAEHDRSDPYIQANHAILADARRTIDAHIGSLELSGGPPGTEVWLNGRSIGTLPIRETLRMRAGTYTLEARLEGHYPISRSVALAGGALARESIVLAPEIAARAPAVELDRNPAPSPRMTWLSWTFAGLTAAAGAATIVAWTERERHVQRWNDDARCLRAGQTRGDVCGAEHDAGDRAERWMWAGGIATGVFATASIVSYWLGAPAGKESELALSCGVGLGQALCSGRF